MKIGILTQPLGQNYGGILQNWALQQVLQKLGHSPITINHKGHSNAVRLRTGIREFLAFVVKYVLFHSTRKYNRLPWDYTPYSRLHKFVRKNIRILNGRPSERLLLNNKISHIIIGSDQVWRPCYNKDFLADMYCDFLPYNSTVKVSAYAASFGTNEWEHNPGETAVAKKNIQRFEKVTVREDSGVVVCREKLGIEAAHVLDPTFLLDQQDYMTLVTKKELSKIPKHRAGVFILDLTSEKQAFVDKICSELGLKPYYFGIEATAPHEMDSVEHWIAGIAKCEFILTDSFHGTVFAINFNKPFLSIINQQRGADRFNSILKMFGLTDRAISDIDNYEWKDILNTPIDFQKVNHIKIIAREKSLTALAEMIM